MAVKIATRMLGMVYPHAARTGIPCVIKTGDRLLCTAFEFEKTVLELSDIIKHFQLNGTYFHVQYDVVYFRKMM